LVPVLIHNLHRWSFCATVRHFSNYPKYTLYTPAIAQAALLHKQKYLWLRIGFIFFDLVCFVASFDGSSDANLRKYSDRHEQVAIPVYRHSLQDFRGGSLCIGIILLYSLYGGCNEVFFKKNGLEFILELFGARFKVPGWYDRFCIKQWDISIAYCFVWFLRIIIIWMETPLQTLSASRKSFPL